MVLDKTTFLLMFIIAVILAYSQFIFGSIFHGLMLVLISFLLAVLLTIFRSLPD